MSERNVVKLLGEAIAAHRVGEWPAPIMQKAITEITQLRERIAGLEQDLADVALGTEPERQRLRKRIAELERDCAEYKVWVDTYQPECDARALRIEALERQLSERQEVTEAEKHVCRLIRERRLPIVIQGDASGVIVTSGHGFDTEKSVRSLERRDKRWYQGRYR